MMYALKRFLLLPILLLLPHAGAWAEDAPAQSDYRPGEGWRVPGTGFRLGGYASVGAENDRSQPAVAGIDDLSLFVHWESEGRLRLFSELDLEKPLVGEEKSGITAKHAYFSLERAYADYLYSDEINVRVGKFLTPIGRWNVIHAAPLVWTSTRPLATEHAFPTNLTGAMAYGSTSVLGKDVDYSLYAAMGKDWRSAPNLDPFHGAFGMHVTVPTSGVGEFGVSYADFEQRSAVGERRDLIGLDYFWSRDRYEFSTEMVYRFSDKGHRWDEKGGFVQGVAPIAGPWYAIGRYEFYDVADGGPAMNLWLGGVAMRLSPAEILKIEYSHVTNNRIQAPEGFFVSLAVLF